MSLISPITAMICVPLMAMSALPAPSGTKTDASDPGIAAETIRIKAFVTKPQPHRMQQVLADAKELGTNDRGRADCVAVLRDAFARNWLEPGAERSSLTLEQYDEIARTASCEPFGANRRELVDELAKKLPAAWNDRSFLSWLQNNLPAQINGIRLADRLLKTMPADQAGTLNRFAFALEIVEQKDSQSIIEALRRCLGGSKAEEMPGFVARLAKLEKESALRRWQEGSESAKAIALLGDRLFDVAVADWHKTGAYLEILVKAAGASRHSPTAFLQRAASYVRGDAKSWTEQNAGVCSVLSEMNTAPSAYEILKPDHSVDWFEWLHKRGLIQRLNERGAKLRFLSYASVKKFDAEGHFAKLYPFLRDHYYDGKTAFAAKTTYAEKVFDELLRERAKSGYAKNILPDALQGRFSAQHRSTLGIDCLRAAQDRNVLLAAWPEACRSRMQVAIDLYIGLVKPTTQADDLNRQLNEPLLRAIAEETLVVLRRDKAAADKMVDLLRPLAAEIKRYRDRGADTARSQPLRTLCDEVVAEVDRVLAALPESPLTTGNLGDDVKQAIQRFVKTLALALRLRGVMGEALGSSLQWVETARAGLCRKVFGLDGKAAQVEGTPERHALPPPVPPASHADAIQPTIYWPAPLTTFRAQILAELAPPLRECLELDIQGADRRAFWKEVYVPLVRVHGFLKASRQLTGNAAWPHVVWVRGVADPKERDECLGQLFDALCTNRWLDAEDAVYELADEHRRLAFTQDIWNLDPAGLFAGKWSVNANFRVWKRMLDSGPAARGQEMATGGHCQPGD